MIKAWLWKSHLRVTHQQVDSIDHVITNISRDMIMSVHNEIVLLEQVTALLEYFDREFNFMPIML